MEGTDKHQEDKHSVQQLLKEIQRYTNSMSNTFQETILRHEQQFVKTYKIKIFELSKLYNKLKKTIEQKFINNAITQQLESVLKQRDYFKYQCLKLNTQYRNILEDYKNVNSQMININDQMNIYKHLLQNEKIKSSQIQANAQKLKSNLTQLAVKTIQTNSLIDFNRKNYKQNDNLAKIKKQIKQKNQTIRVLKEKLSEYQRCINNRIFQQQETKQLQQIFKFCVQAWKRQILTKSRKFSHKQTKCFSQISSEQFSILQKKQLLKILFTSSQFLQLLQKMLFSPSFQLTITHKNQDNLIEKNRTNLFQYMKKRNLNLKSPKKCL